MACGAAVAGFAALAVLVAHRESTGFDTWMFRELSAHIGTGPAATMLSLSAPAVPISICATVALVSAMLRRWGLAALAAIGPAATVLLTKLVFKPLLGREFTESVLKSVFGPDAVTGQFRLTGVFPSGHESAVAATACLLVVVTFQLPWSRRAQVTSVCLLAVWTVAAALGLVRNFWHYATDTIGAICLAVTVVLGLALLIDSYGASVLRRARPAVRATGSAEG